MAGFTYEDLRNTICHSFVTVEEAVHKDSIHGNTLIFDDRIAMERKEHDEKKSHGECMRISIEKVKEELLHQIEELKIQ